MQEVAKKFIALQSAIIKQGAPCTEYPELFFPEDLDASIAHQMEIVAIEMCKTCPVKKLCLDYAVSAREPYGIWGGTKPSDR